MTCPCCRMTGEARRTCHHRLFLVVEWGIFLVAMVSLVGLFVAFLWFAG